MVGTVTGKNAKLDFCAHSASTFGPGDIDQAILFDENRTHSTWAISDFSLTFDRAMNEQNLLGERGSVFRRGSLSVDGSLTATKFGTPGYCDLINNMCAGDEDKYKYLLISGTVSTDTDAKYLNWCLASCQVTGFDVSIGDADTITEASIDFVVLNPQDVVYAADSGVKG